MLRCDSRILTVNGLQIIGNGEILTYNNTTEPLTVIKKDLYEITTIHLNDGAVELLPSDCGVLCAIGATPYYRIKLASDLTAGDELFALQQRPYVAQHVKYHVIDSTVVGILNRTLTANELESILDVLNVAELHRVIAQLKSYQLELCLDRDVGQLVARIAWSIGESCRYDTAPMMVTCVLTFTQSGQGPSRRVVRVEQRGQIIVNACAFRVRGQYQTCITENGIIVYHDTDFSLMERHHE